MKQNPLIKSYVATFNIHNEERLILAETDRNYVVWNESRRTGDCFSGHYFPLRDIGDAKKRFVEKISRYLHD